MGSLGVYLRIYYRAKSQGGKDKTPKPNKDFT
jgi:hypothetical protein